MRNHLSHILTALFLAVVMTLTFIPSAQAAPDQSPTTVLATELGSPGSVTDRFINEADGREIAAAQTVKTTVVKNPQAIPGYVYESFSEVTENVYSKECLTYIKGYPDRTVRGERYLSRAEAATIFYRLYDGFYPALQRQMTSTTFSDVPQDAWYINEIELCYNVGIISGYADGTFRPNDPISRAEFAILAARFAELPNSKKQMFSDVTKDHWAYLLINAAAEAGWIEGYGDGTYRPETNISRSETVTLINRLRNRVITAAEIKALGVANPYIDLVESYWAFADLLEATVKHAATDWHTLTYNGGNLNIVVEKYVDAGGKEIAAPTVSPGMTNYAPRLFDRHYYLGYITSLTYIYSDDTPHITATKSADKATAKVGDTLTYKITINNADSASASLENVTMTDAISEYIKFTHGSVQIDGVTAPYSYDNGVLSVNLGDIAPGQTVTITFSAVINTTAYGKAFYNVAVISADNDEDQTVSDDGVTVEDGVAHMSATKTVSKSSARVGDDLTYTVTVGNTETSTVNLKNVTMLDVIPEYVSFSYGSVQVDEYSARYSYDNESRQLSIELGDVAPGQVKTVIFSVIVNSTAYGMTFKNVAVLSADNDDDKTAEDNGVTVPDPEDEAPGGTTPGNTVSGSKTVDKTIVNTGEKVTYSITAVNNTSEPWTGVQVYDVLDTSVLTLIDDSIYIDGIRYLSGSGKWTFTDKQLVINLGDIAAGQTVKCDFSIQFKNDAVNTTFTNHATIRSTSRDSVYVKAPEVMIMGGGDYTSSTDIHYRLFAGFGFGDGTPRHEWRPTNNMQLNHMCIVGYRLMTDYYRSSLGNGTFTVPDSVTDRECQYFISQGVISAAEYTDGAATQSQIYRILNFAIGANLYSNSTSNMTRASVASLICDLTGRNKNPNTNGLPIAFYSDKGSFANLIDEVSNSHDYTIDSRGVETWISILND